jgi:hypothetical protein
VVGEGVQEGVDGVRVGHAGSGCQDVSFDGERGGCIYGRTG